MTPEGDLCFLGVDGSTGRPLESLSVVDARRRAEQALRRIKLLRYGIGSGRLRRAGWGVVFFEGVDTAVRDALDPLLARRRQQAGDCFRELTYLPGEGAAEFRTRLRAGLGRVDPRQVPWYLLLVGDPAELPYGFELDLDVPHAIGRLTFEDASDYAAYAQRIVDVEESSARSEARAGIFAPTHDGDTPTAVCSEHLARPLAALLENRGLRPEVIAGEDATRAQLLTLLDSAPDLLLTISHGVRFPLDHRAQKARQGALVCADWPGPDHRPRVIRPRHTVAATDLPTGALSGGVAVLFGCHTAGTPRRDPFDSDRPEDATILTSRAFVAALAQRLLGRDGGALAVVGHVGRVFVEASCLWRGVSQIGPIEDAVQAILDGRRLGEALDGFGQRFADLAVTWARSHIDPEVTGSDPLDLWLALHDARSWVLLGDPAARLPVTPAKRSDA